jgi:DNA-directed RNA polymerase specialized sigma24 family protein
VWRIVVNEARRLAREPQVEPLAAARELVGNGHGDDPLGLRTWIAALPDRQREAVFLRYYADLEYRAIADVLGIEVGTVSATLSAANQTLRKRVEEVADDRRRREVALGTTSVGPDRFAPRLG